MLPPPALVGTPKTALLATQGVNFINILRARFLYQSAPRSFSQVHFGFIFSGKRISAKKAHKKMLMKLTTDQIQIFRFAI